MFDATSRYVKPGHGVDQAASRREILTYLYNRRARPASFGSESERREITKSLGEMIRSDDWKRAGGL